MRIFCRRRKRLNALVKIMKNKQKQPGEPQEILAEMKRLDEESEEILNVIRGML